MKCVFNAEQNKHYPKHYLVNGVQGANPESPERVDLLLAGATEAGMSHNVPPSYGMEGIQKVHSKRYLTFLENASARWQRIKGGLG